MTHLIQRALSLLTLGTALGCGLVAGIFLAFSNFVTPALNRLPASQSIAAMQEINVVVLNRWFLGLFSGTALACLIAIVLAAMRWSEPSSKLAIVGAVFYVVGTFVVTMALNVPLNDMLVAADPHSADAASIWKSYYGPWMTWNHLRTFCAFAGSALMTVALLVDRVK